MTNIMIDENLNPEGQQEPTPSVEPQTPAEVREDVKTPVESIPYERFQEVNNERKELKEDIKALREQIATPPQEENEPETWQEVQDRAVNKAVSVMQANSQKTSEAQKAQDQAIDKNFQQIEAMGQTVSQDMRKAVLGEMVRSGKDVFDSYLSVKDTVDKTAKTEQMKQEGQVPASTDGGEPTQGFNYADIRGKSPSDIADEASG